jgi:hypothetical protein
MEIKAIVVLSHPHPRRHRHFRCMHRTANSNYSSSGNNKQQRGSTTSTSTSTPASSSLSSISNNLPKDIITRIGQFLDVPSIVTCLRLLNKHYNDVSRDAELWKYSRYEFQLLYPLSERDAQQMILGNMKAASIEHLQSLSIVQVHRNEDEAFVNQWMDVCSVCIKSISRLYCNVTVYVFLFQCYLYCVTNIIE